MTSSILPKILAMKNSSNLGYGIRRKLMEMMPKSFTQTRGFSTPHRNHNYHHWFSYSMHDDMSYYCSDNDSDDFDIRHEFVFSDSDSDWEPKPIRLRKKPNILKVENSHGIRAHLSLMKQKPLITVPIRYNAKKNKVVFDRYRYSIVKWYSDRISSYQLDEEHWLRYIAPSAHRAMRDVFAFLKFSFYSGVALSSDNNGHFFKHVWIDGDGDFDLFLPFHLTATLEDKRMDLQVFSNFIYVVYNKRPLEEMEDLAGVVAVAERWLETTPRFLRNLYHFLPTFDPNKHCVEVTFNPPYLWDESNVLNFVRKFAACAYEANNADILNRLVTEMGFSWVDKLPEKGNLIRDLFDEFGGLETYKENIDILTFYEDFIEWGIKPKADPYSGVYLKEEDVFIEVDTHFGLLWILYRLCTEFLHTNLQEKIGNTSDSTKGLLHSLGFIYWKYADPTWFDSSSIGK